MTARLILLLLVFCFTNSMGQSRKDTAELLGDDFEWSEGSILLSSGEELKGLIKFNDRNGVLAHHDGDNSRPFSPRSVSSFEFFDERVQQQRVFYSLEDEDPQTNAKRPLFFELLRDYKTFAILLRTDRTEMIERIATAPGAMTGGVPSAPMIRTSSIELSQSQTVCILNSEGEILHYFKCITTEDGRKSWSTGEDLKTKNKMIDEDLLEEYITEPVYAKLVSYAKGNKLNFKELPDFRKVLEYCDTLMND
jgi:hypothetical protein